MREIFQMFGVGFLLTLGMMSVLWLVYLLQRNASIADIGWALGFVIVQWAFLMIDDSFTLKKLLFTFMVSAWGLRLAIYLLGRYKSGQQDPRYAEMSREWGLNNDNLIFYLLFLFQGVLVVILSVPLIVVTSNPINEWHILEGIGFAVWLIGLLGEAAADQQLEYFIKKPENAGKVCKKGLWRYSRHPNYFFEWIVWIGFFLFALPSPGGVFAVISPIIMLVLLLKVSGVPATDAHLLRSKGEEYQEYMQTTSSFILWFP